MKAEWANPDRDKDGTTAAEVVHSMPTLCWRVMFVVNDFYCGLPNLPKMRRCCCSIKPGAPKPRKQKRIRSSGEVDYQGRDMVAEGGMRAVGVKIRLRTRSSVCPALLPPVLGAPRSSFAESPYSPDS